MTIVTEIAWNDRHVVNGEYECRDCAKAPSHWCQHRAQHLKGLFSVTPLLALILWGAQALAGQVQLAWDAPTTYTDGTPLTDLAGYHLYYWQNSAEVQQSVDVGNQTTYTLTGLVEGATYSVAVTAYTTSGTESSDSNRIVMIQFEAEGGALYSPMAVGTDTTVSTTQYVWVPETNRDLGDPLQDGGFVHYSFAVPTTDAYVIWGRVSPSTTGGAPSSLDKTCSEATA
jgi:hypothetical protein